MVALKIESFTPKHLSEWTKPDNYCGASHYDSYVFLRQHRDSDVLTRSNFEVGLERLGGESETVEVIHEGHWAVGWVQWIKIDGSNIEALNLADEMAGDILDYPVLDESHWSEKEHDENYKYCQSEMSYFLGNLCEELEIDESALSKNAKSTLEQFIEAAFFYRASQSGEGYFEVSDAKKDFESITSDCDYYRTMKGASKKMIKLLDKKFGE